MTPERLYHVIRAPHVSEKTARAADKFHQIVFEVDRRASKPEIKAAVEKMVNVQVERVAVANVAGKRKRTGRTQDWKKAYVTLKPGQDIDFLGAK